jgi:peptidyl-prolyl cis-trans isomerase D
MPVMETIRRGTDSTAMKVLFGIIVLVFVFWGVGSNSGPQTQTVAEVNGKRISDTDYQRVMRQVSKSQGQALDEDQLNELARQVIAQLIEQEVLLQHADSLDIEVSDEEIARYVLQYDAFKDNDGKFSKVLYDRTLKRLGLTRGKFEEQARRELQIGKLRELAASSVHVSAADARRQAVALGTSAELRFVRIPDLELLDDVKVDDAAVALLLSSGDPRVKEQYDADFDRHYNQPRKANLSMILLRTDIAGVEVPEVKRRAEALHAALSAGEDFATLARTWSEDLSAVNGGAVGTLTEQQMDPPVARVVFEAGADQLAEVVQTGRGFQVIRVGAVEDARVIPFDEVRERIARDIVASQEVGRLAGAFAEELLAAWKAGSELPADRLLAQNLSVGSTGPFSPAGGEVPGLGPNDALLAAVARAQGPGPLDGVFPMPGGRVIAYVDALEAPDDAQVAAQSAQLQARLLAMKQQVFLQGWTDSLVAAARVNQLYKP